MAASFELRWQRMLKYDAAGIVWIRRLESRPLTSVMRTLTTFGDAKTWMLVGGVLLSVNATRDYALILGVAAGLATALSQVLKRLCRRPRPTLTIGGFQALAEHPDEFSFPSGHTTAAVSVAIALAGQGDYLGTALGLLALGIATSRVYLGAHYPLDVAAGALFGAITGLLTRALML